MFLLSRRRLRDFCHVLFAFSIILLLDFLWSYRSSYPPLHLNLDVRDVKNTRSVYIASSLWNSGALLQDHWIPSLLEVADALKAANISVFISVYENGSWDSTKPTLQRLRHTLAEKGIPHQITIDDTSHEQIIAQNASSFGWLKTAYGGEMRRIPYLASVRNEALKPLFTQTNSHVRFDKIVFINDVVFKVSLDPSRLERH